jgi:fructosamine-3-kinase
MSTDFDRHLRQMLSEKFGLDGIPSLKRVSGGDINDAFRVEIKGNSFFVKTSISKEIPADFYQSEASGLKTLQAHSKLRIPIVEYFDEKILLLDWIPSGAPHPKFSAEMAAGLAEIHQTTSTSFGAAENNYIGTLQQDNTPTDTWPEFYIARRLEPLLSMARDKGWINTHETRFISRIFPEIERIVPSEPSALLHGDLWIGNVMTDTSGSPVFIDPSVYYGHRETDLAMSLLFGGFHRDFYSTYNEIFPLESGWRSRMPCHQLYPLLVHTVLYGGNYASKTIEIIKYYIG